jgi:hypothetical protein
VIIPDCPPGMRSHHRGKDRSIPGSEFPALKLLQVNKVLQDAAMSFRRHQLQIPRPQHFLYFSLLPHGHGALRPIFCFLDGACICRPECSRIRGMFGPSAVANARKNQREVRFFKSRGLTLTGQLPILSSARSRCTASLEKKPVLHFGQSKLQSPVRVV